MTNTEAIKELERQKMMFCYNCVHPQMVGWCENHCWIPESYDMAINALKAQEKSQEVSNNSPELDKENGELISRRQAINALDCINGAEEVLMRLPSVQPQLIGWWIDRKDDVATCSVCGKRWGLYRLVNYCPNCGARLKESEE